MLKLLCNAIQMTGSGSNTKHAKGLAQGLWGFVCLLGFKYLRWRLNHRAPVKYLCAHTSHLDHPGARKITHVKLPNLEV